MMWYPIITLLGIFQKDFFNNKYLFFSVVVKATQTISLSNLYLLNNYVLTKSSMLYTITKNSPDKMNNTLEKNHELQDRFSKPNFVPNFIFMMNLMNIILNFPLQAYRNLMYFGCGILSTSFVLLKSFRNMLRFGTIEVKNSSKSLANASETTNKVYRRKLHDTSLLSTRTQLGSLQNSSWQRPARIHSL